MSEEILQQAIYDVQIDLLFQERKFSLDDLVSIIEGEHPFFPDRDFDFLELTDLEFNQVDDFFGFEDGGDVIIWLYPLVNGNVVYHHQGPYTGLRLDYSVLKNPIQEIKRFLLVISLFAQEFPVEVVYPLRGTNLGNPLDLNILEADIDWVVQYWRAKGIEPGSDEARRWHH